MQPLTGRRLVAGATALLILLTACGSDEKAEGDDETKTTDTTEAPAEETTTTFGRAPCTPESLTEAAIAAHPGVTASLERCTSASAIALLSGGDADGQAAFFKAGDGSWVFISVAPADAATADALPAEISKVAFQRWLAAKNAPETGNTTSTVSDDPNDLSPEEYVPGTLPLATTTTIPPTTTTTVERQIDPYCIEHPDDESCIIDPYLPE